MEPACKLSRSCAIYVGQICSPFATATPVLPGTPLTLPHKHACTPQVQGHSTSSACGTRPANVSSKPGRAEPCAFILPSPFDIMRTSAQHLLSKHTCCKELYEKAACSKTSCSHEYVSGSAVLQCLRAPQIPCTQMHFVSTAKRLLAVFC